MQDEDARTLGVAGIMAGALALALIIAVGAGVQCRMDDIQDDIDQIHLEATIQAEAERLAQED